jgi:hypothetical protein
MHGCRGVSDRRGTRVSMYRCTRNTLRGKSMCRGTQIYEKVVNAGVMPYLAGLLPPTEIEEAISRTLARDGASELEQRQRARHTAAMGDIQQRLDNLRLSLEVTSDREEHVRKEARIARLKEQMTAHQTALDQVQARRADHQSAASVLRIVGNIGEVTMLEQLARSEPRMFQQLLRAVFESITVEGFHVGKRYSCRVVAADYTEPFAVLLEAVQRRDIAGIVAAGHQLRLVASA